MSWLRHREWLQETDSTQTLGACWMRGGGALPALFVADHQWAGRGRWGRSWRAPPGKALLLTVASAWPPAPAWWLLGSALVWAETLGQATGLPVRLKWPNDLLLHGRKLGGGLLERGADPAGEGGALLGWGINVNLDGGDLPPDLQPHAVSLRQVTGRAWERGELLEAFLERLPGLEACIRRGEADALRRAWLEFSDTIGGRVRVVAGGRSQEGRAVDLTRQGALLLETETGRVTLAAGEAEHLPAASSQTRRPGGEGL